MLETVWLHCDEPQQVGCLRGLKNCPMVCGSSYICSVKSKFLAVTSRFYGYDVTSCDITIPAILSDYIISQNGRHFVITDGIFQHFR